MLNKYLFEFANIRDQCSWVHMHEWDKATAKARDLVRMSVMRAALLDPLTEISIDIHLQCVGSREQRVSYCNRICCMVAIKNSIAVKEKFPQANANVLRNDIEVYGVIQEEWYKRARAMGIRFRKYSPERLPEVSGAGGRLNVKMYMELMQREIDIPADLVVLSSPLVQTQGGLDLARMLRVPVGQDKFFFEAHVKLRPVDFATDGIFVCGTAQSPKDVAESVAQAHAAASHAVNPMRKETVNTEAITSSVNQDECVGCGFCAWVCPFGAVTMVVDEQNRWVSSINAALCKGCGACAAGCPTLAIKAQHFTEDQTMAQIKSAFPVPGEPGPDFEPQILAFTCNWCSYAGADLAGVSRFQYPANVRIIRLVCSARIDPLYMLEAFRNGADGVLMSGCHIGDCHYINANLMTEKRYFALKEYLGALGVDPDRLHLAWISAAEGEKWSQAVKDIVDDVKRLWPMDRSPLRYKESERSPV